MTLREALDAATPTTQGDRFAIAEPFPDVTFIASLWAHRNELRVRGHRWDSVNKGNREIVEAWDVEKPGEMTIPFRPLAK